MANGVLTWQNKMNLRHHSLHICTVHTVNSHFGTICKLSANQLDRIYDSPQKNYLHLLAYSRIHGRHFCIACVFFYFLGKKKKFEKKTSNFMEKKNSVIIRQKYITNVWRNIFIHTTKSLACLLEKKFGSDKCQSLLLINLRAGVSMCM